MTNIDALIERLQAASRDERLSTGMLYREAADALAALQEEAGIAKTLLAAAQNNVEAQAKRIAELEGKQVPREPTQEMIYAVQGMWGRVERGTIKQVWIAMHDAATGRK
jgi:hypothetical protein